MYPAPIWVNLRESARFASPRRALMSDSTACCLIGFSAL